MECPPGAAETHPEEAQRFDGRRHDPMTDCPKTAARRRRPRPARIGFRAPLAGVAVPTGAQDGRGPANASHRRHGSGRDSDSGRRTRGDAWAVTDPPGNLHLDRSGNRWQRNRGLQLSEAGRCILTS
jgi:hypothetical protein